MSYELYYSNSLLIHYVHRFPDVACRDVKEQPFRPLLLVFHLPTSLTPQIPSLVALDSINKLSVTSALKIVAKGELRRIRGGDGSGPFDSVYIGRWNSVVTFMASTLSLAHIRTCKCGYISITLFHHVTFLLKLPTSPIPSLRHWSCTIELYVICDTAVYFDVKHNKTLLIAALFSQTLDLDKIKLLTYAF